jgi:Polyketide cyclase / dehydrase and lipid transport
LRSGGPVISFESNDARSSPGLFLSRDHSIRWPIGLGVLALANATKVCNLWTRPAGGGFHLTDTKRKTFHYTCTFHFKDVRKKRDTMKFNLAPNTEELLTKATWRFQSKTEIDLPADTVWSILVDDRAWKEWHPEVTEIVWTDEAPHKTGSERTVVFRDPLTGPIKFYEEFDVWEEGHRFGIHFTALSLPTRCICGISTCLGVISPCPFSGHGENQLGLIN